MSVTPKRPSRRGVPIRHTRRVERNAAMTKTTVIVIRSTVNLPVSDSDGTVIAKPIGTRYVSDNRSHAG